MMGYYTVGIAVHGKFTDSIIGIDVGLANKIRLYNVYTFKPFRLYGTNVIQTPF